MVKNIQPVLFWNSVSNYSQNSMTNTQADFELSKVYGCIDANPTEPIKDLFCFGVADGVREPISILQHIEKQNRELPSTLIVNDIAINLLDEAKDNLVTGGWHKKIDGEITYFDCKVDEIEVEVVKKTKLRLGVIGVYNLGYLNKALKLYQENLDIIGIKFNVYPVYLNDNEENFVLEHGETVRFDITDSHDDIIRQIHNNVDPTKQLYAQCVYTTDKHFVSHYFDCHLLKKVISHVFFDYDVDIQQEGNNGRYLIVQFQCNKGAGSGISLMTSLNNVLGNITTDDQIKSLKVLKNILD